MKKRFLVLTTLGLCAAVAQARGMAAALEDASQSSASSDLASRIEASPSLPFHGEHFAAQAPRAGWESGSVSSVAIGADGLIYELQRGDKSDPVVVLDARGKVLRSWGKGNYKIPHTIRLDPSGNVWTVDASLSTIIKYSRRGKKLMTIKVGEQPQTNSPFDGTTDIAFAPNGHLFITDGYGNARVLEYSPNGKRLRQWGQSGEGRGEFHLPHAIQIAKNGTIFVADRENGRIEKFDLNGNYLGQIAGLGRVYSLKVVGDVLWATMQRLDQPTGSAGWIVKMDRDSGKILGHLTVAETSGLHSIEVSSSGEPIITLGNQLLWFRRNEARAGN
jgi:DNA-binding beta-propeller fold protein YncE